MSQAMLGAVETVTNPVPLRETGERTVVKTTLIGLAVGAAVAGARVAGASVTGVCVTAACVAGATIAGACVGVSVRGGSDAVAAGITPPSRGGGLPSRGAGLAHPASTNRTTQIETKNRFPKSHPSLIQL
jgi:hypothetical protein